MSKSTADDADRLTASLTDDGRYRLLVQAVTDYAIYMLDPTGIITSWNPGAERFKGYTAEEIIGRHFSTFYTPEDKASGLPHRALETAAREGKFEHEGWRVRKDGSRFWAYVIIDPIRAPDGSIVGFAKVTRDLTERRQSQEALERTREQLRQSQKMEALGQLTGGVAHDFNNLLMVILGTLELVRKRIPPDPRVTPLIENAIQAAERGKALTQRMLAFARRQELTPESVDLNVLVRSMADLLRRSLGPGVDLETRFPLSLERARADPNQLELAVLNLAINARDAMEEGGRIEFSARSATVERDNPEGLEPGRYVCLAVADTGDGMDAEILARATEPFFTTKGIGKGTGLGLSMVQGMAEQLGGRFRLSSKVGEGTTAEIWLPAADEETPAPAPVEELGPPVQNLVVLAVDDDALVLMNTVAMLEDLGHTALEARSGKEALQMLGQRQVDLVITDQSMPNMTGLQLAEAIRATWPGTRIILASGYSELPPQADLVVPRMSKPFDQRTLSQAIAQVVH
jgi:PAS domain S-box-containing protein